MSRRRPPRRRPAATWVGLLGAVLLGGFAVLAGQHAAVERGWADGPSWLREAVVTMGDREPSIWILIGGFAAVLLGLWFLTAAFAPGRRSHLRVEGDSDLWIAPGAVEALAADAAERTPGVLHGRGEIRGRRLRVAALLSPGADAGVVAISEAVGRRTAGLTDLELSVQAKEARR